jgi:hypothetical protein
MYSNVIDHYRHVFDYFFDSFRLILFEISIKQY